MMLPPLRWLASPNYSSRGGARISKIIAHSCEGNSAGAVSWFAQPRSQVSAHLVLSEDGASCVQMVAYANKAWHVCALNPTTVGVEMGGFSAKGFDAPEWQAAANIVAFLLRKFNLPPTWAKGGVGDGFCSHHDLGVIGGGHQDPCEIGSPTWMNFASLVSSAYLQPMPAAWTPAGAPTVPGGWKPLAPPAGWNPSATVRHDLAEGSLDWIQMHLNARGFAKPALIVDGLAGPSTERAVAAFQQAMGLYVDGEPGAKTIAALAAA
jgi:N-acetyl-anhydromuramyl-L-alanine amidase AmpD